MVNYDIFEKAPERRRRSAWSRVRRRPRMLSFLIAMAVFAAGLAVYAGLRATHNLPAQIRARKSIAAVDQLIASQDFERRVVSPLARYLTDTLVVASHRDALADFVHRRTDSEVPTSPVVLAPKAQRSPLIRAWRSTLEDLDDRNVPVYGFPEALRQGDQWLRAYVVGRFRDGPSDATLAKLAPDSVGIDRAVNEIVRRFGVSPAEFFGILYVADSADRLRRPAVGRTE